MKKIILLFCLIVIISCKKETLYNNYDEITHYSITDKIAEKSDTITRFKTIYSNLNSHEINFNKFEEELLSFGFTKHTFQKEKTKAINDFITNKIYFKENFSACIPQYRDILILKNKGKIIAVLKICFECTMTEYYGKINSNFTEIKSEEVFNNYFNEFNQLHYILTGKTKK